MHEDEDGSESEHDGDVAVDAAKPTLKEPPKFAVYLHNDDYTTMEFVIEVLARFFRKNHEEAVKIMLKVHHEGRGVAGVFTREIAETKVDQVTEYAKTHSHPLLCTAEEI
ncbi:MAG: ATP-dependent Clp protease adapter ClpS [Deltaproteobacteria bacterium]|nr:ATP-dependent Clp protease adapter ClpS [Deltaproteobacteria bacterium]